MKEYLKLQLRLTNRKMQDAGMPAIVGYVLLIVVFLGMSVFLFYKSKYAPYLYLLIALSFLTPLSEVRRNEFLKTCFGDNKYRTIRLLENHAVSLPFILFLFFKMEFIIAGILALVSLALALSNFNAQLQFTISTPFGKKPYEFATGFRGTYYVLFIAYVLAIIAVSVSNFNLGVFALLMVFVITLSYYAQPEHEYYVWSHSQTPAKFLIGKMKTALLYSTLLSIPLIILLCAFFFSQVHILLLIMAAGYVYLCCIIAARYSAYPNEMGLPQGILLALCIVAPPAAIIILPYFFNRSVEHLQLILK